MKVKTTAGAVSGVSLGKSGVTVFKGIPYAHAERWRPPVAPQPWAGVRECDEFGPICPQKPTNNWPMDEDCLSINIWTPQVSRGASLPVLIWIYGGRFCFGASRDPQYDGAAMAAKGVVFVSLNYRLGVFGWLSTPELVDESGGGAGNYGLLDQMAALRWVRDNIAEFGGDPARVTIAGQSAGAASVMLLAYSPLAQGLFRSVIALSGASHPGDPGLWFRAGSYRTKAMANIQGVSFLAEHGATTIAQARRLPVAGLLEDSDSDDWSVLGDHQPPLFRPLLDGHVMTGPYWRTLAQGTSQPISVMTGTVKDEDGASPQKVISLTEFHLAAQNDYGSMADEFLSLYPAANDDEAAAMSNQAANDLSRTSTNLWARLWGRHNTAFTYFWTHTPPGPNAKRDGAYHSGEIWYFLDSLGADPSRPFTDDDYQIASVTSGLVANFVATGNPNTDPSTPIWPTPVGEPGQSGVAMELGDNFGAIPVATDARFDFHRRFLESNPQR